MSPRSRDDYVDVSERIEKFYARYPEGSLRCASFYNMRLGEQDYLVYVAEAWRTPDDAAPAQGTAWEPVPGKTNFTRDSEAMNAETSAWGRAIAALGFEVRRGIASRQEVQNRRDVDVGGGAAPSPGRPPPAADVSATPAQKRAITTILNKAGVSKDFQKTIVNAIDDPLTKAGASRILDVLNDETIDSLEGRVNTLLELGKLEWPSDLPAPDTDDLGEPQLLDGDIGAADESLPF